MKKKLILFSFIITLSLTAIVASSMTEASIFVEECIHCGACYMDVGEPFYEDIDGAASWGRFETGAQWGMRFYAYPTAEHEPFIKLGKAGCPALCIYTW